MRIKGSNVSGQCLRKAVNLLELRFKNSFQYF